MNHAVVLAETDKLKRALFAFRHRIYVDELGGTCLRNPSGELCDDLDAIASNYAVLESGRVVGSLRVIDWSDFPTGSALAERYGVEALVQRAGARAVCHGGRLAVDKSMRGSSCVVDLLARAVRDRVPRGIRFVISDCSPELFPLYAKIGYVRTRRDFVDPDFGWKWSMIWCIADQERMQHTGSPLLSTVSAFPDDADGRALLQEVYPERIVRETEEIDPLWSTPSSLSARRA